MYECTETSKGYTPLGYRKTLRPSHQMAGRGQLRFAAANGCLFTHACARYEYSVIILHTERLLARPGLDVLLQS